MSAYLLSPRARADLDEIWDYTTKCWGVTQAEMYLREIQKAVEAVAAAPQLGRSCETIRAGYWKYPAGSHVIFFRLVPNGIDVVRVLHNRMDFGRHL